MHVLLLIYAGMALAYLLSMAPGYCFLAVINEGKRN